MDIRKISPEEKVACINELKDHFRQIRNTITTIETDMQSDDLMTQASAVWISANLCHWFADFMKEIMNIHQKKDEIQKQMMDASNEKESIDDKPTSDG